LRGIRAVPNSDQFLNREILMTETSEKAKVTKTELNDMILARLGFAAFLTIHKAGQGLGFTTTVVTAPAKAIAAQQAVDNVVAELRTQYELED
jgi:hypothetical protein